MIVLDGEDTRALDGRQDHERLGQGDLTLLCTCGTFDSIMAIALMMTLKWVGGSENLLTQVSARCWVFVVFSPEVITRYLIVDDVDLELLQDVYIVAVKNELILTDRRRWGVSLQKIGQETKRILLFGLLKSFVDSESNTSRRLGTAVGAMITSNGDNVRCGWVVPRTGLADTIGICAAVKNEV